MATEAEAKTAVELAWAKVVLAVVATVLAIAMFLITLAYQTEIVLPQKMADRNYCWRELPTSDRQAYQPCELPGGGAK